MVENAGLWGLRGPVVPRETGGEWQLATFFGGWGLWLRQVLWKQGAAGGVIDCSQFGIFHTGAVS